MVQRPGKGSPPAAQPGANASSDRLSGSSRSRRPLSHLDLDDLLDALLIWIRDVLDVETASVLLRFGDVLTPIASRGFEEEVGVGIQMPIGKGVHGDE